MTRSRRENATSALRVSSSLTWRNERLGLWKVRYWQPGWRCKKTSTTSALPLLGLHGSFNVRTWGVLWQKLFTA
ncbi:hypothetical protein CGCSCA4_v006090 [Colletotrichum siamense]|uniref:Uncharacterized protein n=1 Tax=Colletotrichum siamense TaxID=690259 RepID=A0A9P5EKH6_COLSI|nr:hypothetical protein CGCSCA4_v006090 [Colletotrichum siamense]KAF4851507.1 hypothetical protein CGCSCA2_v010784 [Colletotrichum siamense]